LIIIKGLKLVATRMCRLIRLTHIRFPNITLTLISIGIEIWLYKLSTFKANFKPNRIYCLKANRIYWWEVIGIHSIGSKLVRCFVNSSTNSVSNRSRNRNSFSILIRFRSIKRNMIMSWIIKSIFNLTSLIEQHSKIALQINTQTVQINTQTVQMTIWIVQISV